MRKQARKAEERRAENPKRDNVRGVKGKSPLKEMPLLDESRFVIPEWMHAALLGIAKLFLYFWCEKGGPWNFNASPAEIDKFFKEIQAPDFITRPPKSINNARRYKASEFYYWLMYFSLPTLEKFLPEEYFQHWVQTKSPLKHFSLVHNDDFINKTLIF